MRTSIIVTLAAGLFNFASTASALPPDEYVSGLLHQPLGTVSTFTVDGRKLTACCLGSSGEDGVEVQLHSQYGGGVAVDLTELQTPSPLAREIRIQPRGWDGTIMGSVHLIGNPDGSITEVQDFSTVGATSIEWRALDVKGALIDQGAVMGPVIVYGLQDIFTSAKVDCFYRKKPGAAVENSNTLDEFDSVMTVSGVTPAPMTDVREFIVTPVACGGCPDPLTDLESVLITASGINELVVSEGQLRTFGVPSWGLGQAHLAEECIGVPPPCAGNEVGLLANNLGSSGEDGVSVDFGPGSNGGTFTREKCRNCLSGHVILIKLYDDESQEVSRVAQSSGTGLGHGSLEFDFSAIGSLEFDAAYIGTDGAVLAIERCGNGTALEVPDADTSCAGNVEFEWKVEEGEKVVLEAQFCGPSGALSLPSGAGASGVSALRVVPVAPTVPHHRVRRLEFTSADATDIGVAQIAVSTPVYVSGLPHEFSGEPFDYSVSGRKLMACCLGSTGKDGVEVRFDSVHGGGASIDIEPLLGATGLQREFRVQPKGWDGTKTGQMRIVSDPDGVITEEYDFTDSNASEMEWRLLNVHGGVLAEGVEPGAVLAWELDVPVLASTPCQKLYSFETNASSARAARQGFFDRVVTVSGLTPDPVSGVQIIEVVPVPCAGCPNSPLEDLRSVDFNGDGIAMVSLSDAHVRVGAVDAWGHGHAHVREECRDVLLACDPSQRVLAVENLGSSGQDGVTLDYGPDSSGGSVARSYRCKGCPPGHTTLMKLYDDESVETFRVTHSENPLAGQVDLTVDSVGQGSTDTLATFFDSNGGVVAAVLLDSVSAVSYPECLADGTSETWTWTGSRYAFHACGEVTDYVLPGGGGASGVAHVEFEPLAPSSARASRLLEISSNDPGGMVIESAAATPVAIGDIDRDGDLDLVDYGIIAECHAGPGVSSPGPQCGSSHFRQCDMDKDEDVDLDDFAEFQKVFPGS